jgi:rapamycin-insensitive companion of mTOR
LIPWTCTDDQSAFVGFTEDQAKPSTRQPGKQLEKINANVKNIIILLNTWSGECLVSQSPKRADTSGLLYLCMDGRRAITSLVSSLLVPNDEMRDALLNLLFTIFKIKLPTWKDAFLDGKRLTGRLLNFSICRSFAYKPVYNRAQEAVSSTLNEETGEVEAPDSLNLIDQYVALLMATFIDAGLLDVSLFRR